MKSNTYKEYIAPVVVLVAICLVVSAALALTYGVANPIIVKNAKANADKARVELLSDAKGEGFEQVKGTLAKDGQVQVTECYKAKNQAGAVMMVQTPSFGGALTMMVGINKDGEVTGVKVMSHSDTPGVGTKNWDGNNIVTAYEKNKDGKKVTEADFKQSTVKKSSISYISGASVSGNALYLGVKVALKQFSDMGGVK